MFAWLIKTFGTYEGKIRINHGSFEGKYEVYKFLGAYHEIRCD